MTADLGASASHTQASGTRLASSKWLVLVIACLAQFMVVLDATVVNVALPSIQRGLHFSPPELQWVVNAYTLVFGGFLLLGGRAADLIGRRRLFVVGIALFTAASLFNGLSQSSTMLIFGRGLQGLGAALVSPAALSIIMTTFRETGERTRALGVWSAIAAGGAAFGLLLGGILTDLASWQWCFFVNVPVGVATVLLAQRFVPESRADLGHRTFDLAGATAVTAGLITIVFSIVKAQAWGWGSGRTLGLLGAGLLMLAAFFVIESRSAAPLVRLGIFRVRTLLAGNNVMLLVASGMFGMFFFASLYVQDILGYSPLKAGFAFLPVTLGIMIGAGIAQQLIGRVGVRAVAVVGITIAAAGMFVLTGLPVHGHYVSDLLVGLAPMSLGMGLTFVPITLLGTSGVGPEEAGTASGLFNTSQQVGGSFGLAILSTLAAKRTSSLLSTSPGGVHAQMAASVAGYHVAFAVAGGMLLLGAALLIVMLRRRHLAVVSVQANPAVLAA
ncbi:MAG: MFS transporter [Solirubrobacteraceae bacterium]